MGGQHHYNMKRYSFKLTNQYLSKALIVSFGPYTHIYIRASAFPSEQRRVFMLCGKTTVT